MSDLDVLRSVSSSLVCCKFGASLPEAEAGGYSANLDGGSAGVVRLYASCCSHCKLYAARYTHCSTSCQFGRMTITKKHQANYMSFVFRNDVPQTEPNGIFMPTGQDVSRRSHG